MEGDQRYYAATGVPEAMGPGDHLVVADEPDGGRPIGTASYRGRIYPEGVGTLVFSLEVHGREVPGTWTCQDREFVRFDAVDAGW